MSKGWPGLTPLPVPGSWGWSHALQFTVIANPVMPTRLGGRQWVSSSGEALICEGTGKGAGLVNSMLAALHQPQ